MKYSGLIFIAIILVSCGKDPWTKEEKNMFQTQCIGEGGDKSYCDCYMEKVMDEYPRYEDSNNISFEEAVELSKDCE